jgi:glutamyl/glutaminyl-tRNA synthetase
VRGDEWLGTLPLHVQLYDAFGFQQPTFAHISPIAKMEGNTKRKLSKRKDPEANVAYYFEQGYPAQAILEYLLNIADSGFSDWRSKNPTSAFSEYPLALNRMSVSMALFDLQKLNSISREVIASYSSDALLQHILAWAEQYSPHLAHWINSDLTYAQPAFNIGRDDTPPRKDLTVWSDVEKEHGFFFDEYYAHSIAEEGYKFPNLANTDMLLILDHCLHAAAVLEHNGKDAWLQDMKLFAEKNGFAVTQREYKNNPARYKGTFGQFMEVCRVALTNKAHTPDLYAIMRIMGMRRASTRLNNAKMWLESSLES